MVSVCDTKVLYDTEFEAEVAAAHHDTPMKVYQCGRHFHLAHADPSKSIGHGQGKKYARCPNCKEIYRRRNPRNHYYHAQSKCMTNKNQ